MLISSQNIPQCRGGIIKLLLFQFSWRKTEVQRVNSIAQVHSQEQCRRVAEPRGPEPTSFPRHRVPPWPGRSRKVGLVWTDPIDRTEKPSSKKNPNQEPIPVSSTYALLKVGKSILMLTVRNICIWNATVLVISSAITEDSPIPMWSFIWHLIGIFTKVVAASSERL